MNEILKLLKENNEMLKEILVFLRYFQENDDMRQFSINVAADLFVEMLENNPELKDKNNKQFQSMSNILEQANKIVNERSEEKERQYGPFQASMERAAALYNLMSPKDQQITTAGMYRAMIALKLSREAYAHKEDNLLDAVAYMGSMNDYLEEHKDIFNK